jgi:hypothetical protein
MALSTLTTMSNALKDIFLDPITKMINEKSGPVLAAIEKSADDIKGGTIKFAVQYGRHGGIGAIAEDGDLPAASPRKYIQGVTGTKNLVGRINFTEKLMLISKNDKASFVDQVSTQMEDITNDLRDMMRRNMMGTQEGIMATVKSNVSSSTDVYVLDSDTIKSFYAGQQIDILTISSGTISSTKVDGGYIADVDYANKKLVLTASCSCAANDVIVIHGNYGKELIGLKEIFTPNNIIYGINRANNKWFNAQVFDHTSSGSTVAFSSLYLQEALDEIEDYTGEKPDFICCNAAMKRAYIQEQNTYKRNIEYKTVDGGYKTIAYNDVAVSQEKYMDDGDFYIINTKDFTLAQVADWGWLDADGAILSRVPNKAAYEAALTKYCELICRKPNAQALVTGITGA